MSCGGEQTQKTPNTLNATGDMFASEIPSSWKAGLVPSCFTGRELLTSTVARAENGHSCQNKDGWWSCAFPVPI